MKQIKMIIGKGGKVIIDAKGAGGEAKFTEDLAKDLGDIEERHKGIEIEPEKTQQQVKQNG